MSRDEHLRRVTADPDARGGKPIVRGTRVYVAIVLDALAEGLTPAEIVDHFPQLTLDDVSAALAHATDRT